MQLVPKFQSMEFQVAFWKIFGLERIPWLACRCSEIQTNTADGKKKKRWYTKYKTLWTEWLTICNMTKKKFQHGALCSSGYQNLPEEPHTPGGRVHLHRTHWQDQEQWAQTPPKRCFPAQVSQHWHRSLRGAVVSPSVETLWRYSKPNWMHPEQPALVHPAWAGSQTRIPEGLWRHKELVAKTFS